MSSTPIDKPLRAAIVLVANLALVPLALAGPTPVAERHPRLPDQPLQVRVGPYHCPTCVKKGLQEAPEEGASIRLLRNTPEEFAHKVKLRSGWFAIETPNFKIFSSLKSARIKHSDSRFAAADLQRLREVFPTLKPGSTATHLTGHQRAHLYHVRLERLYAHFSALTGNKKRWLGMHGRFEIFLFEKEKPFRAFLKQALKRGNQTQDTVMYHEPSEPNFQVFGAFAKHFRGGDRQLNSVVFHSAAQLLVNGHRNYYSDVWAWLEEGIAHYYARRECDRQNHFCLRGGHPPPELVRGNWRKKIHYSVYHKEDASLGHWCEKLQPHEFAPMEHALSWAIIDWLMRTDPVRLSKLLDRSSVRDAKRGTASEAIEDVFGVTPHVLHDRWRSFVLKEYRR
jgi:hypothetical protein